MSGRNDTGRTGRKPDSASRNGNRRVRYGIFSTLLLLVVIAALLAVNVAAEVLERKNGWRVDCSFNAVTTQSEKTVGILAGLKHPVHIYALFTKGREDAPLIELLDRYAAASPMVTWEQVDPSLNPAVLTRFSGGEDTVSSDSLIVDCPETGRYKVLSPQDFISLSYDYDAGEYRIAGLTYESSLTGAISHVTQDRIPRIVMLQGHGELDAETSSALETLLRANNYEVVWARLTDGGLELKPEDTLAILSPLRDLSDDEMKTVTDFAGHGGSLLLSCDYSDPVEKMPNWMSLLRSYGFEPKKGIVVASKDEPNTFYNNIRIDVLPEMCPTDITADLLQTGQDRTLMTGARAFAMPGETDRNLITSPVLKSSDRAYIKDVTSASTTMEKADGDETGPFALALQARRVTADGYVSRAFIVGCSAMLTGEAIHAMTDTQQLIIRAAEFLTQSENIRTDIMAKLALRPQLSAESTMAGSLIVVALPVLVLMAALVILVPRRRR